LPNAATIEREVKAKPGFIGFSVRYAGGAAREARPLRLLGHAGSRERDI